MEKSIPIYLLIVTATTSYVSLVSSPGLNKCLTDETEAAFMLFRFGQNVSMTYISAASTSPSSRLTMGSEEGVPNHKERFIIDSFNIYFTKP